MLYQMVWLFDVLKKNKKKVHVKWNPFTVTVFICMSIMILSHTEMILIIFLWANPLGEWV